MAKRFVTESSCGAKYEMGELSGRQWKGLFNPEDRRNISKVKWDQNIDEQKIEFSRENWKVRKSLPAPIANPTKFPKMWIPFWLLLNSTVPVKVKFQTFNNHEHQIKIGRQNLLQRQFEFRRQNRKCCQSATKTAKCVAVAWNSQKWPSFDGIWSRKGFTAHKKRKSSNAQLNGLVQSFPTSKFFCLLERKGLHSPNINGNFVRSHLSTFPQPCKATLRNNSRPENLKCPKPNTADNPHNKQASSVQPTHTPFRPNSHSPPDYSLIDKINTQSNLCVVCEGGENNNIINNSKKIKGKFSFLFCVRRPKRNNNKT